MRHGPPYRLDAASVTGARLVLEVGERLKIRCDLKRHLSPRTVGFILRALPVESNAQHLGSGVVYMETGVDSGAERPRREFRAGDVAFLPMKGAVCFFIRDTESPRAMARIGRLVDDPIQLESIRQGDVMRLYAETG